MVKNLNNIFNIDKISENRGILFLFSYVVSETILIDLNEQKCLEYLYFINLF